MDDPLLDLALALLYISAFSLTLGVCGLLAELFTKLFGKDK